MRAQLVAAVIVAALGAAFFVHVAQRGGRAAVTGYVSGLERQPPAAFHTLPAALDEALADDFACLVWPGGESDLIAYVRAESAVAPAEAVIAGRRASHVAAVRVDGTATTPSQRDALRRRIHASVPRADQDVVLVEEQPGLERRTCPRVQVTVPYRSLSNRRIESWLAGLAEHGARIEVVRGKVD